MQICRRAQLLTTICKTITVNMPTTSDIQTDFQVVPLSAKGIENGKRRTTRGNYCMSLVPSGPMRVSTGSDRLKNPFIVISATMAA